MTYLRIICCCCSCCCCLQIYASRIAALETQVLVDPRPQADITKELHLLGNDLKGEQMLLVL